MAGQCSFERTERSHEKTAPSLWPTQEVAGWIWRVDRGVGVVDLRPGLGGQGLRCVRSAMVRDRSRTSWLLRGAAAGNEATSRSERGYTRETPSFFPQLPPISRSAMGCVRALACTASVQPARDLARSSGRPHPSYRVPPYYETARKCRAFRFLLRKRRDAASRREQKAHPPLVPGCRQARRAVAPRAQTSPPRCDGRSSRRAERGRHRPTPGRGVDWRSASTSLR